MTTARRASHAPLGLLVGLGLALAACDGGAREAEIKAAETAAKAAAAEARAKAVEAQAAEAEAEARAKAIPGDPNEACAKIVVVAYQGATDADPAITRDKAAAAARAHELHARIAGGAALDEVAAAESDDARTRAKRGAMGTFTRESWPERFAALMEPILALPEGGLSAPLEAPMGYVIAQRCAIDKVHTRHILIRYKGAKNADAAITRSRAEALAIAEALALELAEGASDFEAVARAKSEDGSAERGGDLGPVGRGMFAPAYEAAAFALPPGGLSKAIETDFGFHIIQRVAP